MADNKVSVEISLEEKAALRALTQLTKEVQKTETEFKNLGDSGDKSLNILSQAGAGVSDGFKSLVGGVTIANLASSAIIGTANALKGFLVDSVNAAIESEQATNQLAQALRASGSYSAQAVEDFKSYAGALAETTIHSDDQVLAQIALAKSFGATNSQAKQLVLAASELAATYGGSLEQRVQQLGKTLQGTGGKLDTLIPGFKSLTEEQLKAGKAFEFVNEKLGGSAQAQLDSYSGKLGQLKKSVSELQESLGLFVVESGVSSTFESIAFAINKWTQAMADARTERQREAGGMVETTASLEQLKRKYEETQVAAFDLEQKIINPSTNMDQTAIFIAKKQLKELNEEIARTKAQIDTVAPVVQKGVETAPDGTNRAKSAGLTDEDKKRIESRREAHAALIAAEAEFNAYQNEQRMASVVLDDDNKAIELEKLIAFEQEKVNAKFIAEEQKAALIADSEARQLTQAKIASDKRLALQKVEVDSKKKIDQQLLNLEVQKQTMMANFLNAGANLAAAIAKDGSKEQFAIQKAAAIAQAYVAMNTAMAQALALPLPPPAPQALAAQYKLLGGINIAAIAATAIKGFEFGGVVPGNSFTGDGTLARVNSQEVILNRNQQAQVLMEIANGGGSGGSNLAKAIERLTDAILRQPIHVSLDSRKIAEGIRNQVQSGFKLA